jgi:hypothetical protein
MLEEKGLQYEEIILGRDATSRSLRAMSGNTTTPQVFMDGQLIGGCGRISGLSRSIINYQLDKGLGIKLRTFLNFGTESSLTVACQLLQRRRTCTHNVNVVNIFHPMSKRTFFVFQFKEKDYGSHSSQNQNHGTILRHPHRFSIRYPQSYG